ncbi:hypothetical protein [Hymenobacter arizonensis]|uniref:Uncharacterized protein n=1 Tax=Hymenobacter arizonensis TaxID=1227077 RepID=A0A1I5WPK7_HYMAR|nr:hypothetical protein [Hymenobacter arizonensis]SFQ21713.1 hypothetical protein SAMN04515668_1427 [Hymenobacter arizonensis]
MKTSLTPRPAQSLAGISLQSRAQAMLAASFLRPALLGALVVLSSAGTALAQDVPSVKAKQTDGHNLAMTIENPARQQMQLRVVALSTNTCLVKEVNTEPSYGTNLNFNQLPAGKYAVLLRVGQERYRYTVQVASRAQTTISVPELATPQAGQIVASATR